MSDGGTAQIEVRVNNVKVVKAELADRIALALDVAGGDVESIASENAPVDTDRLSGSITHALGPSGRDVYVGTNVEYAIYQELGTSKMQAANDGRGYLRPAVTDNKSRIAALIRRVLET